MPRTFADWLYTITLTFLLFVLTCSVIAWIVLEKLENQERKPMATFKDTVPGDIFEATQKGITGTTTCEYIRLEGNKAACISHNYTIVDSLKDDDQVVILGKVGLRFKKKNP